MGLSNLEGPSWKISFSSPNKSSSPPLVHNLAPPWAMVAAWEPRRATLFLLILSEGYSPMDKLILVVYLPCQQLLKLWSSRVTNFFSLIFTFFLSRFTFCHLMGWIVHSVFFIMCNRLTYYCNGKFNVFLIYILWVTLTPRGTFHTTGLSLHIHSHQKNKAYKDITAWYITCIQYLRDLTTCEDNIRVWIRNKKTENWMQDITRNPGAGSSESHCAERRLRRKAVCSDGSGDVPFCFLMQEYRRAQEWNLEKPLVW
jgi:hypothetical protein